MRMVEWVEFDTQEPDVPEVMQLTTEPAPQPVHDRRPSFEKFPSAANLTIEYLESIGIYDGDD